MGLDLPADTTGNDWYPLPLGVFQIILMAAGGVFTISGVIGACISCYFEHILAPEVTEQAKRLHDCQINYPRCSIASQEQGLKIITPWKEYFTRDEKPFVAPQPLP
uniref:Nematode cuticle collagen N-terminal domain-containing protein n=1 Tax=Panagrellus redivivus TaxID=6233 RepID=A0A7E4VVQ7_PANRE